MIGLSDKLNGLWSSFLTKWCDFGFSCVEGVPSTLELSMVAFGFIGLIVAFLSER